MIDSYWGLYVAYIDKCVRDNWANDIDPHHYEMEWNHFLPRCVFGDWPIGQYLTLRQHAVASALQTLVFKKNCMCGWHKKHLPKLLLDLAWSHFCESSSRRIKDAHEEKDERGKSKLAVKAGKASCEIQHKEKDELGRSLYTLRMNRKAHEAKDDKGRSLLGVKNAERLHSLKDEKGRSLVAMKAISRINEVKYAEKDEYGRSIAGKNTNFAKKARPIRVTNLQTGESLEFANSVDAGLMLGLSPRCLRRVASGERKKHKGHSAEFTAPATTYT